MFTFKKIEKLRKRSLLNELFSRGKSFVVFPYRIVWKFADQIDDDVPAQICITVSKKYFKRANKRNLVKRRSREVYRMLKHQLYDELVKADKHIIFAVVYISKEINHIDSLNKSMTAVLNKLKSEIAAVSANK